MLHAYDALCVLRCCDQRRKDSLDPSPFAPLCGPPAHCPPSPTRSFLPPSLPPAASLALTRFNPSLPILPCATKWTETVRARDYIEFLNVLWERVRPDVLFGPLSGAPETFPETLSPEIHQKRPNSRPQGAARRQGNRLNSRRRSATCLLYTSPSPRDRQKSRMPSSA